MPYYRLHHKVTLLVLYGKAPFNEIAASFMMTVPRVAAFLERHPPPVIAQVYRPGPADLARRPLAPGRVEQSFPERSGVFTNRIGTMILPDSKPLTSCHHIG